MPTAGFESIVSAGEQPQTYALDRAATGIGLLIHVTTLSYPHVKVNQSHYRPEVSRWFQ